MFLRVDQRSNSPVLQFRTTWRARSVIRLLFADFQLNKSIIEATEMRSTENAAKNRSKDSKLEILIRKIRVGNRETNDIYPTEAIG